MTKEQYKEQLEIGREYSKESANPHFMFHDDKEDEFYEVCYLNQTDKIYRSPFLSSEPIEIEIMD